MKSTGLITLRNLLKYRDPFIFTNIIIDISTACNRRCRYCPVGHYPRAHTEMKDSLFYGIMDQLAKRSYEEEIKVGGGWCEPLLDKRLLKFIRYARAKCPKSFIYTSSNGDLLDMERFKELIEAGLDYIRVTSYDGELRPNLKELSGNLDPKHKKRIRIVKFNPKWANNRAGALREPKLDKPLKMSCRRPDYQMFINAEGKVVFCCNDYFETEIMGDANKEGIFTIWHKGRFESMRADLRRGKRENIAICGKCSYSHQDYRLPRRRSETIK